MSNEEVALLRTEVSRLTRILERALELSAGGSAFAFPASVIQPARADLLSPPTHMIGGRAMLLAARADYKEIELREKFLPQIYCDGAPWNMLLYLLMNRIEERSVSVTDAVSAARVAPTTALRYLTLLVEGGMCYRNPDPTDSRRRWIALSEKAYGKLAEYFEARRAGRWKRGAEA